MKLLFLCYGLFNIASLIQAMDNTLSRTIISCPDIQEACSIDDNTTLLNTIKMCYTCNLLTQEKQILKKYKHYHELIKHPTQPLVTLSDHQGITLYNYKTKEWRYFKTPSNDYNSNTINQCVFNPHNETLYFHKKHNMYVLNYTTTQIIDVTETFQKTCKYSSSKSCDYENKLDRSFDYTIAFDPIRPDMCIAKFDTSANIYDINNEFKLIKTIKHKENSYLKLNPFFCEYALNGSVVILAAQNHAACRKINIFDLSNTIPKTINAPDNSVSMYTYNWSNEKIIRNVSPNFVGLALYPNSGILATLLSPFMEVEYFDLYTDKQLSKPIKLYPKENTYIHNHPNNHFIHFCPNGKKIMVCKKEYDEIIILDVPFDIIAGNAYKKNTGSLAHLYSCILSKYGLIKEMKNYIIQMFLQLQKL